MPDDVAPVSSPVNSSTVQSEVNLHKLLVFGVEIWLGFPNCPAASASSRTAAARWQVPDGGMPTNTPAALQMSW